MEYPLLEVSEFQKVKVVNGTLTWDSLTTFLLNEKGEEVTHPYQIDPLVLYQNSKLILITFK